MGRLKEDMLARTEAFGDRMLDVVLALEEKRVSRRILDQMTGCGTSVGANAFEADQAVSAADFCKCLGWSIKELNESRYWIRLCGRRSWIAPDRLQLLESECVELGRIFGAMIVRTRRKKLVP